MSVVQLFSWSEKEENVGMERMTKKSSLATLFTLAKNRVSSLLNPQDDVADKENLLTETKVKHYEI